MVTAFGIFLAGGVLALLVRWELAQPGLQAMSENTYNQVFTMHGTLMIFLFARPGVHRPRQLPGPAAARRRRRRLPTGQRHVVLAVPVRQPDRVLQLLRGRRPACPVAWTAYPPLSTEYFQGTGMDLWIIGLSVVGIAGILGAVNLVTTIFRMRMPGMTCSGCCSPGGCWSTSC